MEIMPRSRIPTPTRDLFIFIKKAPPKRGLEELKG